MNSENPFLTLKTRGLIPWMLGGIVAFIVALGIFSAIVPVDEKLWGILFQVFFYLLMALWIYRKVRRNRIQLPRFFRKGGRVRVFRFVALVIAIWTFSIAAILLYDFALAHISPRILAWLRKSEPPPSPIRSVRYISLLVDGLIMVVVAPVLEELVFRGLLMNRWAIKWGVRTAVLLSALAFAIPHFSDPVGAFVFGLCMALLYIKTRALWAPMAAHGLNNAIAFAIVLLNGPEESVPTAVAIDSDKPFPWLGLLFLALATPFVTAFIYRNWPIKNEDLPYQPEEGIDAEPSLLEAAAGQVDKLEACPTSVVTEASVFGPDRPKPPGIP